MKRYKPKRVCKVATRRYSRQMTYAIAYHTWKRGVCVDCGAKRWYASLVAGSG